MRRERPEPVSISGPEAFAAAYSVSRETTDRLTAYGDLLRFWQKAVNLVAPSTLDQVWQRHFADSAQLLSLAPPDAATWLDLGSGGGFPGLVLAIMMADKRESGRQRHVTLVESDTRKAAFLREVVRQTRLSVSSVTVDIVSARIENITTHGRLESIDVITARALASLERLLELSAPLFGARTVGLFLKGREVEQEVEDARRRWTFAVDLVASRTFAEGRVAVVSGLSARTEG